MASDSHSELLEWATDIAFYDLPLNTLDTQVLRIKAQTLRSVGQQFKALIHPSKLITVIVGGKEK